MQNNKKNIGTATLIAISLGALGVVYGDIGTSPLYTINEIFFGKAAVVRDAAHIIGAISLVLWSLMIIVAFKYIIFVLRADSNGEGGVFALYSLIHKIKVKGAVIVGIILMFAAGLLYGDGIITPAISVVSAVEGLKIATASFEPYIVPITIAILTVLFLVQKHGTAKMGSVFGPIILVWFIAIGSFGLMSLLGQPEILMAFNPLNAINFLLNNHLEQNMHVLGSVMLAVTGGEAMYADLGHFGKQPIRLSWFTVVFPALLLNYLGQGASLLSMREIAEGNIFYSLVPSVLLIPMVILATLATIIASQALISGAFSLTTQAISLGLLPKLRIKHTHEEHEGQIYVPFVNWVIYFGCIALVIIFQTSTNLASAYGLAVSGVMLATSVGMIFVAHYRWNWNWLKTLLLFVPLAIIDFCFLASNSLKIFQGGYIPLLVGLLILSVTLLWRWGREKTGAVYKSLEKITIKELVEYKQQQAVALPHSSVFLCAVPIRKLEDKAPALLQVFLNRFLYLPKNILLVNVKITLDPHIREDQKRFEIVKFLESEKYGTVYSIIVKFGFMEDPNVEKILDKLAAHQEINVTEDHRDWLIHVIQERVLIPQHISGWKKIRARLYRFLQRNARNADRFFGLGVNIALTVEDVPVQMD